jgi:hypothetical protein
MTRQEGAVYGRCSVATIDRARTTGKLQFVKDGASPGHNGRKILMRRSWIDAWLSDGHTPD